jgi:prepilin-type N-terminal cleavage/methylation domain-containing protein
MNARGCRGFSLIELLIAMTVVLLAMTGLAGMLIQSSRINRSQQLTADAQANARNCVSMIVQKVRSAGWDPQNVGIPSVGLDPDLTDDISQLEIFADLDGDGLTTGQEEQVLIRHANGQVEWRPTGSITDPFTVLAFGITNDADGNGTPEPMFVPDNVIRPTRITVQVTARSATRDPRTRQFVTHTERTEVVLRSAL